MYFCLICSEHKLFVGMLPKTVSDVELSALFSGYGTIKDLQILRGSSQTSKGSIPIVLVFELYFVICIEAMESYFIHLYF